MNSQFNCQKNQVDHNKTPDHAQTDSACLYDQLMKGINDIALGNTCPFAEAMDDVKGKRNKSL